MNGKRGRNTSVPKKDLAKLKWPDTFLCVLYQPRYKSWNPKQCSELIWVFFALSPTNPCSSPP